MTRILIADDHVMFRDGLRRLRLHRDGTLVPFCVRYRNDDRF